MFGLFVDWRMINGTTSLFMYTKSASIDGISVPVSYMLCVLICRMLSPILPMLSLYCAVNVR